MAETGGRGLASGSHTSTRYEGAEEPCGHPQSLPFSPGTTHTGPGRGTNRVCVQLTNRLVG